MFGALFLALALSAAPLAPPAPPPPLVVTVDSKADWRSGSFRPDALALANQLVPLANFAKMMEAQVELGLREGLAEDFAELEKDSPGLMDELVAEARASVRPFIPAQHRDLVERSARLYSANLTQADTAALAAFYASSAGRTLVAIKYDSLNRKLPVALAHPDRAVNASDVVGFNRSVAADVTKAMSAEERAQFTDFMKQPAFRNMMRAAPKVAALDALMANESSPELEKALQDAVTRVMERRGFTK